MKRIKPTKPIDTVDTIRVKLGMRLTTNEVPTLSKELTKEIDDGVARIVFDMAETVTIDSKGIGLFIRTGNRLSAVQGIVRLDNVSPDILKLLKGMRLADGLHATGRRNS